MATIILLSALILLHEVGHFLVAKLFKVRIEEFGFGLPPKMLRLWKRGETEYTLNWLPIGGFVRLFGEDNDLTVLEKVNPLVKKRSFAAKPSWQRALILLAGIVTNLFLGILLFSFIYSVSGVPRVEREMAVVTDVAKGSPAELAGITQGDVILKVDGEEIKDSGEFVNRVGEKKGKLVTFYLAQLLPDGRLTTGERVVSAVPRENPPEGQGSLGVGIATIPIVAYDKKPWYIAPFYGVVNGVQEAYGWGQEIVHTVPILLKSFVQGKIPEGTTGPYGVWKQGNKIYEQAGIMGLLRFGAILSINLGIFNLLPIPGLDGGRLLFLGLEKVIGRRRVNKYENYIHMAGVVALIGLLLAITWHDIWG